MENNLTCMITLEIPTEPVQSKYGHLYEKKVILDWLRLNGNKCPMTRNHLTADDIVPVPLYVKNMIEEYRKSQ